MWYNILCTYVWYSTVENVLCNIVKETCDTVLIKIYDTMLIKEIYDTIFHDVMYDTVSNIENKQII